MADLSVAGAKAAVPGIPVTHGAYPPGKRGLEVSLDTVGERIRQGRLDPRVRSWAIRTLRTAGNPQNIIDKSQALLDGLRKAAIYVSDPVNAEYIQAAHETLCLDDKGYCFKGGDCDDLSVALGSALMSVGVSTVVIGQAFQNSAVPQHVLVGVIDPKTNVTYRIDPSSDTFIVGESYPGVTREWHIDPMKTVNTKLEGAGLDSGDIVGVGRAPHGLSAADTTIIPEQDAIYQATTSQLKIATFALQRSVADLTAALAEVENTRSILRPNMPYDPEPQNPIKSLAEFPAGGIWTKSMSNLAHDLLHSGEQIANAMQEGLNGTRQVYIDFKTKEVYIESLPHDSVRYQIIQQGALDSIIGVFSGSTGLLIAGFTALLGAILTPAEIDAQPSTLKGPGERQGTQGVGAAPVVAVLAITGAVIVTGIMIAYIVKRLCETAEVKAREATNQTILGMVASGSLTPEQGTAALNVVSKNRVAELEAQKKKDESDPFASTFKSIGTVIMWAAVGGATIAGIYAIAPLLKEGAEGLKAHRLSKAPA